MSASILLPLSHARQARIAYTIHVPPLHGISGLALHVLGGVTIRSSSSASSPLEAFTPEHLILLDDCGLYFLAGNVIAPLVARDLLAIIRRDVIIRNAKACTVTH